MEHRKVCRLGTVDIGSRSASVYVKIDLRTGDLLPQGGVLAISGIVGPLRSGNALGSAGQCQAELLRDFISYADGWDREKVDALLATWNRWHLNDLKAGSPAQQAHLAGLEGIDGMDHRARKKALQTAGLDPDPGHQLAGAPYNYGSAWLREELPEEVVAFLAGMPEADRPCPWPSMRPTTDLGPLAPPQPPAPTP